MTSEVEICQMALAHIRGGSINSLEEKSTQAKYCNLFYPKLRDQLLRDAPWQFAHKVAPLGVLTTELFNWVFAYQYPSDSFRINRLVLNLEEISQDSLGLASRLRDPSLPRVNLKQQVEYEILNVDGNRVIGANESELRADYNVRVTDPNLFDSEFVMTLSYLLGSALAIPVVGGKEGRGLRSDAFQIYQQYLAAAMASDQNEQFHPPADSEYVTVRN